MPRIDIFFSSLSRVIKGFFVFKVSIFIINNKKRIKKKKEDKWKITHTEVR
jgi:hypothetical protein